MTPPNNKQVFSGPGGRFTIQRERVATDDIPRYQVHQITGRWPKRRLSAISGPWFTRAGARKLAEALAKGASSE